MSETPKFSQRHFELIADTVRGLDVDAATRRTIRSAFTAQLAPTNERFSKAKFERACTPDDEFEAEIAPMIEQLTPAPEFNRRYVPLRVDDVPIINEHVAGVFAGYDTPIDAIDAMSKQLRDGLTADQMRRIRSAVSALHGKRVRMLVISSGGRDVYFKIVSGELLAPKHGGHDIEIAEDGNGTGRRSLFSFTRFAGLHVLDSGQTIGVSK